MVEYMTHPAGGFSVLTQVRKMINKGKQQPMRDVYRNLYAIPAKDTMLEAVKHHAQYPAVGGRD